MTKEQQNQNTQQNKESNQQNQPQSTINRIWQQNIKPATIVLIKVVLCIIAFPFVLFALGWLALNGYDLLFNGDLRAKKSYQREIIINFEYKGKDYTMKPVVTCINEGTTINEGSMEWYTGWSLELTKAFMPIDGNDEIVFRFVGLSFGKVGKVLDLKLRGHENPVCEAILYDENNANENISKFMNNKNKFGNYYYNDFSTRGINIMVFTFNSESRKLAKDELKGNSLKIKSYNIGEKIIMDKEKLRKYRQDIQNSIANNKLNQQAK